MNNFLLSAMLFLSLTFAACPMEVVEEGVAMQAHDLLVVIKSIPAVFAEVCHLDGASFSALTQVSKDFEKLCNNIPVQDLTCIIFADAVTHGNANLTQRYLAHVHNNPAWLFSNLKPCDRIDQTGFVASVSDVDKSHQCHSFYFGDMEIFKLRFSDDAMLEYCSSKNHDAHSYAVYLKLRDDQIIYLSSKSYLEQKLVLDFNIRTQVEIERDIALCLLMSMGVQPADKIVQIAYKVLADVETSKRDKDFFVQCMINPNNEEQEQLFFCDINTQAMQDPTQATQDPSSVRLKYLCLNALFILAVQKNCDQVVKVFLNTPSVLACLTPDTLNIGEVELAKMEAELARLEAEERF